MGLTSMCTNSVRAVSVWHQLTTAGWLTIHRCRLELAGMYAVLEEQIDLAEASVLGWSEN
jgi:hypothetical protein